MKRENDRGKRTGKRRWKEFGGISEDKEGGMRKKGNVKRRREKRREGGKKKEKGKHYLTTI